ncbi:AMP-binding enzyme [Streptomyces albus]
MVAEDGGEITAEGVPGELVVAGDCVTPGYWRREHEPAAAHHRAGEHPTGDVVSIQDGLLVYHGRKDRMVKLNGYRLELGEIEAAALRHPGIQDAAVVVRGTGGDARLVLHYTLREGAAPPGLLALKQHCARHLPAYMVPHSAVRLERMPRNANGKTLPCPGRRPRPGLTGEHTCPTPRPVPHPATTGAPARGSPACPAPPPRRGRTARCR